MLADLKMPGAQIELRNNRRLHSAMRSSRLPAVKTLAESTSPSSRASSASRSRACSGSASWASRDVILLVGPPGVGKSHLAISLAIAAAESGRRVYYGSHRRSTRGQ